MGRKAREARERSKGGGKGGKAPSGGGDPTLTEGQIFRSTALHYITGTLHCGHWYMFLTPRRRCWRCCFIRSAACSDQQPFSGLVCRKASNKSKAKAGKSRSGKPTGGLLRGDQRNQRQRVHLGEDSRELVLELLARLDGEARPSSAEVSFLPPICPLMCSPICPPMCSPICPLMCPSDRRAHI